MEEGKPGRGAVPARGQQRRWVRVKDTTTGHEYDVQERAIRKGMERVPGVEVHTGPRPRPTKHFVGKDGKPQEYVHVKGAPASATKPAKGAEQEGGRS